MVCGLGVGLLASTAPGRGLDDWLFDACFLTRGPRPTTANVVTRNLIGTDVLGLAAVPNRADGVFIDGGVGNVIGQAGAGNLISGNAGSGIQLLGALTTGNVVQGNAIGVNIQGLPVLGNTVERREVTVGENNEKFVEVRAGLTEGESVVLDARVGMREAFARSSNVAAVPVWLPDSMVSATTVIMM